ncbi:cell division protein FtsZ [Hyphobacterium sp. SN044]|uniref:cell division protein FtsZ n=1 Tax=Hyphobacterium sp. SN044 TaxID=2912575 RepID=UPI001F018018|nr:cell division protein FtsZ [Hyphobacterium sp. SN044]MCF8878375.1 cell division protein FtsZ [Hyphobacterium sp. SN044]
MALNLSVPESTELRPRILVFGVGGAGGNAVNNMIDASLEGVDFAVANTDAQALTRSKAQRKIQLGASITEGLGAGARPEIGEQAAEDSLPEIMEQLAGAHMVFITAGMGGGTGTGAAPVVARAAREQGILTVGVITKPFHFEGSRRMKIAESGIEALQGNVDTLIIIPNQNLFRIATEKTTFAEAFGMADQVLHSGVRGITDLMVMPGLINLDFADVRAVMSEMGKAMMGTGEASGEKRAIEAAHAAIANPLLDDVSMKGATGVLINITGGYDMTLYEVDEAANEIRSEVDPEANIIVGSTFDENMEGMMRVSVVATGIDAEAEVQDPRQIRRPIQTEARAPVRQPVREPLVRRAHDDRPAAPIQQPERPAEHIVAPEAISESIEAHHEPIEAETEIEDAHDPFVADERPQVIRDQERIAAEARTFTPAPPRAREPEPESQPEEKGGFSLFGRRKRPMAPVPKTAPTRAEDVTHRPASGDLFGESGDEGDLEIPAFLRRQAN